MSTKYLVIAGGIIIIGLAAFMLSGQRSGQTSTDKLSVVASFYPLYYFASEVGGDRAEVTNIVPAGVEPHEYEPTPQQMVAIEGSGLLILNGADFESWGERVQQNVGTSTVIVAAGEELATQKVVEEGESIVDPHVWLSPVLAQRMIERIVEGFVQADAQNAAYYRMNADALLARLAQLDADYRSGLTSCARKDIVTSHVAFGYLASSYGLTQVAILGLSPEEEPSAQDLAEIARFAREKGTTHIFFETLLPSDFSETIAREIGAKTLVLNPLEGLTDEEIASGKNYFTEMRANLDNLKVALQCQ